MENKNRFDILKKVPEVIQKLREKTQGMNEPMSFSIIKNYNFEQVKLLKNKGIDFRKFNGELPIKFILKENNNNL